MVSVPLLNLVMGLARPQDANKQRHVSNKKGALMLRKWTMTNVNHTWGIQLRFCLIVEEMPHWPVHLPWSNNFICFRFSFISSQLSTSQTAWGKEAPREEVASLLKKASVQHPWDRYLWSWEPELVTDALSCSIQLKQCAPCQDPHCTRKWNKWLGSV